MTEGKAPQGQYNGTTQKVVYGPGSISGLSDALKALGVSKALVVCGPTVAASPLVDAVRAAAESQQLSVFGGSKEHAPSKAAEEGFQALKDAGDECVISLGGSSPVDVAKGIALLAKWDKRFSEIPDRAPDSRIAVPVICIPTTLSQSEYSNVAGITDEETGYKKLYFDDAIMARYVFLDAELTLHTPEALWLGTGVKALDTAIDIFLQFSEPQPFWDALTLQAISDLVDLLPRTKADPSDVAVRQRLQVAAWMGEFARFHLPVDTTVQRSNGWFGAAARHQLGGKFRVRHGEISGVLLPHSLAFHREKTRAKQEQLAAAVGAGSLDALDRRIGELVGSLGLPTRLSELGIDAEELPSVASAIAREAPVLGSEDALIHALKAAYQAS